LVEVLNKIIAHDPGYDIAGQAGRDGDEQAAQNEVECLPPGMVEQLGGKEVKLEK
jgi:hypothetical protein